MKKLIEITTVTPNIDDDHHLSTLRVIIAKALISIGRTSLECRFVFEEGPTGIRLKGLTVEEEAFFRQAHHRIASLPGADSHRISVHGTAPCPAWLHRNSFALPPGRADVEKIREAVLKRFQGKLAEWDEECATVATRLEWRESDVPELFVDDELGEITSDIAVEVLALSVEQGLRDHNKAASARSRKSTSYTH